MDVVFRRDPARREAEDRPSNLGRVPSSAGLTIQLAGCNPPPSSVLAIAVDGVLFRSAFTAAPPGGDTPLHVAPAPSADFCSPHDFLLSLGPTRAGFHPAAWGNNPWKPATPSSLSRRPNRPLPRLCPWPTSTSSLVRRLAPHPYILRVKPSRSPVGGRHQARAATARAKTPSPTDSDARKHSTWPRCAGRATLPPSGAWHPAMRRLWRRAARGMLVLGPLRHWRFRGRKGVAMRAPPSVRLVESLGRRRATSGSYCLHTV